MNRQNSIRYYRSRRNWHPRGEPCKTVNQNPSISEQFKESAPAYYSASLRGRSSSWPRSICGGC